MNIKNLRVKDVKEVNKLFNPITPFDEMERYAWFVKRLQPIPQWDPMEHFSVQSIRAQTKPFDFDIIVRYWLKNNFRVLSKERYWRYDYYLLRMKKYPSDQHFQMLWELEIVWTLYKHFNVKEDIYYSIYPTIKKRNDWRNPYNPQLVEIQSQALEDEWMRYLKFVNNADKASPQSLFRDKFSIKKKFKLKDIIAIFKQIQILIPMNSIDDWSNCYFDLFIEP